MSAVKIVIATTAQPAANPRMVKEVEALVENGYEVKVFYAYCLDWAEKADSVFLKTYPRVFYRVGGDPVNGKAVFHFSRVLHRVTRILSRLIPSLRDYGTNRVSYYLERALSKEKADLYIAHNIGSLPAVVKAAGKRKVGCGFDAEDYHRGEFVLPSGDIFESVKYIEEKYISRCGYRTAASPLIARAYEDLFPGRRFVPVNNVFRKGFLQPEPELRRKEQPLTLFWFSQHIGPGRGLEMIVAALNLLSGYNISLYLMGNCSQQYRQQLEGLADQPARLNFLPPHAPEEIFSIATSFEVGLAAEDPVSDNRNFCLTNKLFTYLLAGNCILASNTAAQVRFMEENPGIGLLYKSGDALDLADRIIHLYNDPKLLWESRQRSRALAATRYNWESEQHLFLEQVASELRG